MYSQFLKSGDVFFDVGANHGNRISPIVNKLDRRGEKVKIVAVEPQAECVKILKMKFGNKITIIPKGLGERDGEQTMLISNADVLSSFATEWIEATKQSGRFAGTEWYEKRNIQMTTLDKLIEEFGAPSFIKIDVEGYELEVLKGLTQPVKMLSFEYATPENTDQCVACIERISNISGGSVLCNYSIGESMKWALSEWLPPDKMVALVRTPEFENSAFGDVYVKYVGDNA
jgi:FkbM family methyltransferase